MVSIPRSVLIDLITALKSYNSCSLPKVASSEVLVGAGANLFPEGVASVPSSQEKLTEVISL